MICNLFKACASRLGLGSILGIVGNVLVGLLIFTATSAFATMTVCNSSLMVLDCFDPYSVEPNSTHLMRLDVIADEVKSKFKKSMATFFVTIKGHSATWKPQDPVEENALSRARRVSELLKERLMLRGVNTDKVIFKVVGASDLEPRVSNDTSNGRALNRRVVIELGAPAGSNLMSEPAWIKDFRICQTPYPLYPDLRWLDDEILETIRNQKSKKRYGIVKGNDHQETNKLLNTFLARWSCEIFHRNLLYPSVSIKLFKPSERYDEKTEQLVSYFQSLAGISPSTGWLDLSTLQAMDRWLGIKAAKVKDPKRIGNPKKSLEIEGESVAFLTDKENAVVAHIFFPTNGADLEKDDLDVLEKVADFFDMQGATGLTFNVLGFADKREKVNFNQMLGEERTASVDEKLRELLTKRKIWNRTIKFFKGEAERPQIGNSADALRRFRRVDVVLTEISKDSCWLCSSEERKNGVTKGRKGCDLLCPKEPTPAKLCDPDETATTWSSSGQISGFCKSPGEGVGLCVMTGQIWIEGGPTNKGHNCRVPYSFLATGVSASVSVPLICDLAVTKLPWKGFKTKKPVSFLDYEGQVALGSWGFELGLGYTKTALRFVQVAKNHGGKVPEVVWDWGPSAGGLSCGASVVDGELKMMHIPGQTK